MIIRPEEVEPSVVYSTMIRAITPRPIAWVSTISPGGVTNLAPFSYFNGVCSRPAALSICPVNRADGSKKDTVINIEATRQFVVNVVPFSLAETMFATAGELEYEESEFDFADVAAVESKVVSVPGVAKSPIRFECELIQMVPVGDGPLAANLIIGKVLLIEISDAVLNDREKIDPELVDVVGRMGGLDYCRTTSRFTISPKKD